MRNLFMLAIMLLWASWVQAASIEPVRASIFPTEDGYALSADFAIDLGPRAEEVVSRGVPLYFNLELDVTRPRKYWIDEHVLGYALTYRLTYNALTRNYRLGTGGGLGRSFDTLADALRAMGRIAALPVAGKGKFRPDETYQAVLRLSFDRGQLPKPFQLDALISHDWQIDTKVLRWQFPLTEQDAK